MTEQLALLTEEEKPAFWVCPSCRGNRQTLRRTYPDERAEGAPNHTVDRCRCCKGQGTVAWDPDDHSEIPF